MIANNGQSVQRWSTHGLRPDSSLCTCIWVLSGVSAASVIANVYVVGGLRVGHVKMDPIIFCTWTSGQVFLPTESMVHINELNELGQCIIAM